MATLMDNLGAAVICSSVSHVKSTVELSISYYSTAKIQVRSLIFLPSLILGFRDMIIHVDRFAHLESDTYGIFLSVYNPNCFP